MTGTDRPMTESGSRAPLRDATAAEADRLPVLFVPGLRDSGPGVGQSRWLARQRRFHRVIQDDWNTPHLNRWAASVARAIDHCTERPLVVAHGFGCLATLRAAHFFERGIAGALLVAPADPDEFGVRTQLPSRRLVYPTILVAGSDDPSLKLTKAGLLATRWGSEFVVLTGAAHRNVESGQGPWPEGHALLRRLAIAASMVKAFAGRAPHVRSVTGSPQSPSHDLRPASP